MSYTPGTPPSPEAGWSTGALADAGIDRDHPDSDDGSWIGTNTANDVKYYDMLSAFIGPRTREQAAFRVQFVHNEHRRDYTEMRVMSYFGPGVGLDA